jgi:phosphoserine phosphatase RsbU/P
MLVSSLASHIDALSQFAQSWLQSGATAYEVWGDDVLIQCWPAGAEVAGADLIEPIRINSRLVGELRLAGLKTSSAQLRLQAEAELIARLVALESDLDNLAEELVETRDQLVALYSITQATQGFQEIDQILNTIVYETARLSRAKGVFLYLEGITSNPLVAFSPEITLNLPFLSATVEKARSDGQQMLRLDSVVISKNPVEGRLLLSFIQVRGVKRAALGIYNDGEEFKASDVKIARAISEYAGIQIENFLMFQRSIEYARLNTEMELAQQVQANLLPKQIPQLPGLDIWAVCNPASHVGGDFYDFVVRPGESFTFVVGDISGKGMPAALLMAMARTLIRKESLDEHNHTPETILKIVNADLYEDFTELNMFATIFIGQIDLASQRLIYANAGHSPVYYCPVSRYASLLEADGTVMGIFPVSQSEDHSIQLQPGDVFLIGTDGLCDIRNSTRKYFGYERLRQFLDGFSYRSAREIAETLLCVIKDFAGKEPQLDDQTLIVIKCTGQ